MKPAYAFFAALLLVLLSGCSSGKFQAQGDAPATERYSQFCLVLDTHSGFTRCETNEVICYFSGGAPFCAIKSPPPAPEAKAANPEPKKK